MLKRWGSKRSAQKKSLGFTKKISCACGNPPDRTNFKIFEGNKEKAPVKKGKRGKERYGNKREDYLNSPRGRWRAMISLEKSQRGLKSFSTP